MLWWDGNHKKLLNKLISCITKPALNSFLQLSTMKDKAIFFSSSFVLKAFLRKKNTHILKV